MTARTDAPVVVRVGLFERFSVTVHGRTIPDTVWSRRSAATLVKLLSLAPGRRLHREQIIDALWPDTPVDLAAPRLHKAAHYARRGLGAHRSLLLVNDMVSLLPDAEVAVDVLEFCATAEAALRAGSDDQVRDALARHGGRVLPEDRYETWADDLRGRVSALHDQLRSRLSPAPYASSASVPSPASSVPPGVHADRQRGLWPSQLAGRRAAGDLLRDRMARTDGGDGRTLIVTGPAGVGKSALLHAAISIATRRGWRIGHGVASSLESPWPYAPVLEAVTALCDVESTAEPGSAKQDLRAVLPSGRIGDDEVARARLFTAVERLLKACAGRHPVLLVVDDVDEADLASVRLLHYLARRAAGHRILVVLAHRSPASGSCLELRDSLLSRDLGDCLTLDPLSPAAVSRLVTSRFAGLSAGEVAEVVTASGGLPSTALQLARFLSGEGAVVPSVRLPAAVVRSLQWAASFDGRFEARHLAFLTGLPWTVAARHLVAGEAAGVLERTPAGHRFRHPLLRQAWSGVPGDVTGADVRHADTRTQAAAAVIPVRGAACGPGRHAYTRGPATRRRVALRA